MQAQIWAAGRGTSNERGKRELFGYQFSVAGYRVLVGELNVELYHQVKRGARNEIDTSDWVWILECPVGSNPANASSSLNLVCFKPRITQMGTDSFPSFSL